MIWLDLSIGTTAPLIQFDAFFGRSGQTDNATRRNAKATMDHADIRGLVTALQRFVAGLPLSKTEDHPKMPRKTFEDSPDRVRASRSSWSDFFEYRVPLG